MKYPFSFPESRSNPLNHFRPINLLCSWRNTGFAGEALTLSIGAIYASLSTGCIYNPISTMTYYHHASARLSAAYGENAIYYRG